MKNDKILVTGCAGFIGFHLCKQLITKELKVVGLDCITDNYEIKLKYNRIEILKGMSKGLGIFNFFQINLLDKKKLESIFLENKITHIVHLAASPGIRNSILHSQEYLDNNIQGFLNLLELCKDQTLKHLIFASSSSVYSYNNHLPFSIKSKTDEPMSFYAVTKKTNELMAHCYSYLFRIPCTGLRFFSVYGPWGRPDMSYFKWTMQISQGEPIEIFDNGTIKRDFTYIDDIVYCIVKLLNSSEMILQKNCIKDSAIPFQIYNIGNKKPVSILYLSDLLEKIIGKKAIRIIKPVQPWDLNVTLADTTELENLIGIIPSTDIEDGLKDFVSWFNKYYFE